MQPTLKPQDLVKTGLLLINVGTPKAPTPSAVKQYLREFLMDPWVIDIPFPFRWMLVNFFILPKRSITSAEAYSKIWTERGAPLSFHLNDLTEKVQARLQTNPKKTWVVKGGMRYQNPSITQALNAFKAEGIREIVVLPVYPQYSMAATESCLRECQRWVRRYAPEMNLKPILEFYHEPSFIQAFADVAYDHLKNFAFDHLLFSFHGLPERQIKKISPSHASHCAFSSSCCETITEKNRQCYRAQCFATAHSIAQSITQANAQYANQDIAQDIAQNIAKKLTLSPTQYTVCFQSRLGRTPWIKPFTDELYRTLPAKGVKRLAVICPSFTADCLETLEEVAIRGKTDFIRHGGEDLTLVPSLNSSEGWVNAICTMAQKEVELL